MKKLLTYVPLIPILEIGARFLAFFSILMITRILSVEDYGRYSYVLSLVLIVSVVMDGGINSLVFNLSLKGQLKDITRFFAAKNILSVLASVVFFGVIYVIDPEYLILAILITATIFFTGSNSFVKMIARGQSDRPVDILAVLVEQLIKVMLVLLVWALHFETSVEELATLFLIVSLFSFVLVYSAVRFKYGIKLWQKDIGLRRIFKKSRHYLLYYFAFVALRRVDAIFINESLGEESVAYFSASFNIFMSALLFFNASITSQLKNAFKKGRAGVGKMVLQLVLFLTVLMAACIFFSEQIFAIIYPEAYLESHDLLIYLVCGLPFVVMTHLGLYVLNYNDREAWNVRIFISILVVKMVLLSLQDFEDARSFAIAFAAIEVLMGIVFFVVSRPIVLKQVREGEAQLNMESEHEDPAG